MTDRFDEAWMREVEDRIAQLGRRLDALEARPWLVRAQDRFGAWLVRQSPPVWVLLMTVTMLVSITFVALWGRVLHWFGVI